MKKMFAVILSLLFLVTCSLFVMGCKKPEEQKPAEVKTVAPPPAPAPAPAATTEGATPAPAGAPAAPAATTPAAK